VCAQCALHSARLETVIVDRAGLRREAHRREQIEQRRQRGVFDDDAVAVAEMFAQHALNRIEGARGDGDVARRNAVGLELGGGEGDERLELERIAVGVLHMGERVQMWADVREEFRVGIAGCQIDRVWSCGVRRGRGPVRVRVLPNVRSAPTAAHDESTRLQQSVRSRHCHRADVKPARQVADRRQLAAGLERTVLDRPLHGRGDFYCI